MFTIDVKSKYLLVTIEGSADYQLFKTAFEEVMARKEYQSMNDIWQLEDCTLTVAYDQYEDLVNVAKEKYPKQVSRTKTAIVNSSGVSRTLLQLWMDLAESLPYEIQIFMSMNEAEAWIE